jgi:hypothetical protein
MSKISTSLIGERPLVRASTPFGVAVSGRPVKAHEYIEERLANLRADPAGREQFFMDVDQVAAERRAELRNSARPASPERQGLLNSPGRQAERRLASRQERRAHEVDVTDRREALSDALQGRREWHVEQAYRDRIVERSARTRCELEEARAQQWAAILCSLTTFPKRMATAVARAKAQRAQAFVVSQVEDPVSFAVTVNAIRFMQRWWRACRARIMMRRYTAKARLLRHYFSSMHRIKVKFCVVLHRMRTKIIMIQRRRRAVLRARQLRREAGARLVAKAIERECAAIDKHADASYQQIALLEKQLKATIKARRYLVEAKIDAVQSHMQQNLRRRTSLKALMPESIERMWEEPILMKEEAFNDDVFEFGVKLSGRREKIERAIRQVRLLRASTPAALRAMITVKTQADAYGLGPIDRPYSRVGLSWDEARRIVKVRGVALGYLDFRVHQVKLGLADADPAMLADAENVLPAPLLDTTAANASHEGSNHHPRKTPPPQQPARDGVAKTAQGSRSAKS